MDYYYINTDTDALGYSPHDKWIELGYAFTSGDSPADYEQYGERALGRLEQGDTCFMYANGLGVVAAGEVKEPWDLVSYQDEDRLVYQQTPYTEYRIPIHWCYTCVDNPINVMDFLGWPFVRTLAGINERQALALFEEIKRRAELEDSQSESEPDTEAEPEFTTVDPEAFFDKVVGEYALGTFETRKIGSQWCLMDKSYAEDYSLAVIENDILYLTYSLKGEGARPSHPLYKDMDKGTPQKRIKKLCACISIHSPEAGVKLRAYIDIWDYKKA